jgi:NitT/TauT family transport system ATP-binding protein
MRLAPRTRCTDMETSAMKDRGDSRSEDRPVLTADASPRAPGPGTIEAKNVCLDLLTPEGMLKILDGVTLSVRPGEYVGVVGPSGSGKTMFLNIIAGLEQRSAGLLTVFGEEPRPGTRAVGYAMARDGLLPWRTAVENVALSLEASGVPKVERRQRALEALDRVGLAKFADSYRSQLSQGMRQRVALARTLVPNPQLLLLDEPFAALDAHTRILMQEMLCQLLEPYEGTMFLVTHDIPEAILLCDRVLVFSRRPATIRKEFEIDLPRPRSALHLRSTEQFQWWQARIWEELAEEVQDQ